MNWLAHVFLSEPDVEFQLGNLLADVVRGPQRDGMSASFVRGAACHKAIDAFTDAHPVVKRSRARIGNEYRRFSGVLVDMFYDYFLARDWERYSSMTLDAYTSAFYASVQAHAIELPPDARTLLERMSATTCSAPMPEWRASSARCAESRRTSTHAGRSSSRWTGASAISSQTRPGSPPIFTSSSLPCRHTSPSCRIVHRCRKRLALWTQTAPSRGGVAEIRRQALRLNVRRGRIVRLCRRRGSALSGRPPVRQSANHRARDCREWCRAAPVGSPASALARCLEREKGGKEVGVREETVQAESERRGRSYRSQILRLRCRRRWRRPDEEGQPESAEEHATD